MSNLKEIEDNLYKSVELEDILGIVGNILDRYAADYAGESETDIALSSMFKDVGAKVGEAKMLIIRNWLRLAMSEKE
jgi:hypothetical protein